MRLVIAYVPEGRGDEALQIAQNLDGYNLLSVKGQSEKEVRDIVFIQVSNYKIDALINKLQGIDDLRLTILPQGVISLKPPAGEAPDQAIDVDPRSTIEIFLNGLQSIGSWKGFLGYSAAAGVVVWIALYTNTVYLLVAAMLIAPFAGPAMTMALGTARGDKTLMLHSLGRYFSSIGLCIVTTALLSTLMGQEVATQLMVSNSLISSVTGLLPLVAGAAGALNLSQSENNSLVTAAGTGMLVAASLAPPAGLIGMASAIGEWDMVKSALFVLILQLVGINLSGAIVFALFGLKPKGVRYERGKKHLRLVSVLITILLLGGLATWQFSNQPNLQRSSLSRRIVAEIKQSINKSGLVKPVKVNVEFTRADIKGQNTLLINLYLQKASELDDKLIKDKLTSEIKKEIKLKKYDVTPLIDITLLK